MRRRRGFATWLCLLSMHGHVAGAPAADLDKVLEANRENCVQIRTVISDSALRNKMNRAAGAGSGFAIDESGLILTNYHIVARASKTFLYIEEDAAVSAHVVACDPVLDLALLQSNAAARRVSFQSTDASRRVKLGDTVTFCASPLNLFKSTLFGRVCSVARVLDHDMIEYVQIVGVASQGSSGAAVTDMEGRFVGILSKHASSNPNVGFVIPARYCLSFLNRFRRSGCIYACWLGLELERVCSESTREQRSVFVSAVHPNSPAFMAHVSVGDRVIQIDGHDLSSDDNLMRWRHYFYSKDRDDSTRFLIVDHDNRKRTVHIKGLVYEYRYPHEFCRQDYGVMVKYSTPFDRIDSEGGYRPGLVVTRVLDPSIAAHYSVGDFLVGEGHE